MGSRKRKKQAALHREALKRQYKDPALADEPHDPTYRPVPSSDEESSDASSSKPRVPRPPTHLLDIALRAGQVAWRPLIAGREPESGEAHEEDCDELVGECGDDDIRAMQALMSSRKVCCLSSYFDYRFRD